VDASNGLAGESTKDGPIPEVPTQEETAHDPGELLRGVLANFLEQNEPSLKK
jgi:hypothetical protein